MCFSGEAITSWLTGIREQGILLAANTYQPDDLVWHLAPHLGQAPQNIAGLHLFSFNQVESTQNWRMGFLDDLKQQNRNIDGRPGIESK
jgi:hypothetical protein